ncbi:MAG TPA: hypothetical protein VKJ01_24560 [Candidatus Solibacter sp.]|nr:hypothetical protein [Candidatus Solibacter sp.]
MLELTFHVRDHFLRIAKGSKAAAFFQVFFGFVQPRIDDAPLSRGVFGVGVRKLGTVNHQPGGNHNFAALESKICQVALGKPGLATDAGGNGHLPFVLDFGGGVHGN